MDFNPLWGALLAGIGASTWAVFTKAGNAVLARLAGPYRRWRDAKKAVRAAHAALPGLVKKALDRTEQYALDKVAADALQVKEKTRITRQIAALHSEVRGLAKHLSDQDRAMARDREVLADIFSMTQSQFENWHVAAFTCDADGHNTQVNAAWAELAGVDRADLMERRWQRIIHPKDLVRHLEGFKRAREGHYEFDDELTITPPGREPRLVRVHMIPHPREKGPAVRWSGTVIPL